MGFGTLLWDYYSEDPKFVNLNSVTIKISEKIITTTGSGFTANLTCEFKSRLIPRVDPVPFSVTALVTNQSPVRFGFTNERVRLFVTFY